MKNCPACRQYQVSIYTCDDLYDCDLQRCQDCTDCIMKCIKSKLDYLKCYINNDNSANLSKMNEIIDSTLKLLNIQEVE